MTERFEKHDVVKVTKAISTYKEYFKDKEGIIIERDPDYEYQNKIIFFDKGIREQCKEWGEILFSDDEIEGV